MVRYLVKSQNIFIKCPSTVFIVSKTQRLFLMRKKQGKGRTETKVAHTFGAFVTASTKYAFAEWWPKMSAADVFLLLNLMEPGCKKTDLKTLIMIC